MTDPVVIGFQFLAGNLSIFVRRSAKVTSPVNSMELTSSPSVQDSNSSHGFLFTQKPEENLILTTVEIDFSYLKRREP